MSHRLESMIEHECIRMRVEGRESFPIPKRKAFDIRNLHHYEICTWAILQEVQQCKYLSCLVKIVPCLHNRSDDLHLENCTIAL